MTPSRARQQVEGRFGSGISRRAAALCPRLGRERIARRVGRAILPRGGERAGHVLIVDPDCDLCGGLVGFLEASGYRATAVHDGHAGLSAARSLRPDVAVVEVFLPGLSGYEVCRELRDEFGPALPIILVSGERAESYDRVAGLLIGADD